LPSILQDGPNHVDHNPRPGEELFIPPNFASTLVGTEPNTTVKIEAEDAPHRPQTSSKSNPIDDVGAPSDSDLTEIDDVPPGVAFGATPANLRDTEDGEIIRDENIAVDPTAFTRRSARRRCPTRRQTLLWEEPVDSSETAHPRRRHSLPAPGKPSDISTTHPRLETPLRATKQKVTTAGRKAYQAKRGAAYDIVERRKSSRIQTAAEKSASFAKYSDENDDELGGQVASSSGSAGSSKMAAQNDVPDNETETEDYDVVEPDSWKAGWSKSDSWAKESPPKTMPIVKDDPVASKKSLRSRSNHRSQRTGKAIHKKAHSKLLIGRRVECPKGCGKTFGRTHDAHRHADQTMGCGGGHKGFVCPTCRNYFSRKDALKRHQGYGSDGRRSVPRHCTILQSD
jgi:hypothetical protein